MWAWLRAPISVNLLLLGVILPAHALAAPPDQRPRAVPSALHDRALAEGEVRVLVELALPSGRVAESALAIQARAAYRQEITDTGARVLSRLANHRYRVLRRYLTSPLMALSVDASALKELEASNLPIKRVMADRLHKPVLWDSVPLIGADQAWAVGFDGSGKTVAVIDSGVDSAHPFLAGKVIEEACYSTTSGFQSTSLCPNGADEQTGPGAGIYCPLELEGCWHGTHVAGIVAGDGTPFDLSIWGVGRGATLMSIQVFSRINSFLDCGGAPPCLGAFTSDILAALERVYDLRTAHDFASVNMSLGGGLFSAACDDEPYKPFIDNLRAVGIATVIASGNDGSTSQISAPACVSSAVSVGATTKDDRVADYSNVAPFMSLFAPGDEIVSSYPGENFAVASGTSMAAPHVAGTWAILKQAAPTASVDEILQALTSTGFPMTDTRAGGATTRPRIQVDLALSVLLGENQDPPVLSVTPLSQDFGTVPAGSPADRTFTIQNTGGGILTGTASATPPFSVVSGSTFHRGPNSTQSVVVRFSPTTPGVYTANVTFTSNGGDVTVAVSATGAGVSAIAPSSVDLASPPATFTISGFGFANVGYGLPVVNFMRGGALIAQARATGLAGSTTLTVPYPTQATAITPNMPGLSVGSVQAQVWQQTSSTPTFSLIGSGTLTVTDTRGVSGVTPSTIDLASPPASFTFTGGGFANLGYGLPVVNFIRNGTMIAQARATGLTGSTTLTVPYPTQATAITPNMPGLSVGSVQAQVWQQTSSTPTFSLIGSATLTATDTRPVPGVSGISPNPIDLVSPPAAFTITGTGLANLGFGLPVVNFIRNGTMVAQARATGLTGSTALTVPYPTQATAITPNMPGLAAGQVQAQVWQQTGSAPTFSLIGTVTLTVIDTRGVSGITPSTIDLVDPPAAFTITGGGFANLGFGLPVVNFMRGGTLIAQARATALTGGTTLTVPYPTQATAITPNMPGLSAGSVQAQVWQQTGTSSFTLIGSAALTVTDTRPVPGVSGISPNPIELATPPAAFTITGTGFANLGFGLPVVNFMRGATLIAQARATALTGSTTLTVPFPTQATAITPNMPGLSAGPVQAQVWQQTGSSSFTLAGAAALTVTDTRRVDGITPASIDLATPPATFAITGIGFSNLGYGLPVVNFMRGTTLLAQARAIVLTGGTTLTVPYPTQATAITPNLPGLSVGPVQAQVWRQATPGSFTLVGSADLTVTNTGP
jgi:Subtilase family/HYDIN/CFA65/VesB-like, Ig-like domain